MSTTISALCADLDVSEGTHLPTICNNSSTFSSLPELDSSMYSHTSNDSQTGPNSSRLNLQLTTNSSNETSTSPLSCASSSKMDLSVKLQDKDSESCRSPSPAIVVAAAAAADAAAGTKKSTPTPPMAKARSKEFPATQPVLDAIEERDAPAKPAPATPPPAAAAEEAPSPQPAPATTTESSSPTAAAGAGDAMDAEQRVLGRFGYSKLTVITKTLQGNIFVATHGKSGKTVVIKKTSKKLHNEHVTVQNGRKFGIYENILKECIILKYLTENKNGLIMTSFTKYDNFFDDETHYYLSMEHGGSDLFDFIIEAHELIAAKKLKIKEWRKFTKYLFWQMIVVLKWLHNDMSICHLDISLENILCKNATFIPLSGSDGDDDSLFTINPNVQIKICDFGLAEIFRAHESAKRVNRFECRKYCGKTNYKAPQVYSKKRTFDARKADIWSLGVVLFCMLVGSPPYNKPIESDQAYLYIKNGIIDQLLFQWERNHFITVKVLSLLHCMLKFDEEKRFLVDDVITHPWLSLYYNKYKAQMNKKSLLQQQKNRRSKPKLPYYKLPATTSAKKTQ